MNTHSSTRQGLSLVEVLISIGVMAIGILGAAALLPIGGAEIAEATRLERGASIGRAAYRDTLVRGTIDPARLVCPGGWRDSDGNALQSPTDHGNSVCIDPLFWAVNFRPNDNAENARIARFPARLDTDTTMIPTSPNPPRMTRATLVSGNPNGWMSSPEADAVFRWHDDLVFQPFDENDFSARRLLPARPRQIFERDDLALSGRSRQYAGDYSFLITLTPAETEDPDPSAWQSRQLYTASFVVFHKRDLLAPQFNQSDRSRPLGEKMVMARFDSTWRKTLGGGTLVLRVPDTVNTTDPESVDLPKLRANQWILLAGWTQMPIPAHSEIMKGPNPPNPPLYARPVFKWHRVAAILDQPRYDAATNPKGWVQRVSVAGPDWDSQIVSADGGSSANLYAILLDGVVGVYEKTIALQR